MLKVDPRGIEKARRLREAAQRERDKFAATRARLVDERTSAERAKRAVADTLESGQGLEAPGTARRHRS
jgi:hypothetical protein